MANTITNKFNNNITSIQELREYLMERIEHIKKTQGKDTSTERELKDILDMLG